MHRCHLRQLSSGSGGSRAVAMFGATGLDLAALKPTAHLTHKDVQIALELCEAAGSPPPEHLSRLASTLCERLCAPLPDRAVR